MTLEQVGQLAVQWRTLEQRWLQQREPVNVGQLGFQAWKETERSRDAALDALRAAVDQHVAE